MVIQSRVQLALRRITILTCFAVFAGTGVAVASCPSPGVSTPFSHWGDTNNYFLVPGGSFEGTSDNLGWSLSNASLTPGNEPFDINGSADGQSLTINPGGSATSPYFCIDNTMSNLRFLAQEATAGSDLQVLFLVRKRWHVIATPVGDLTGDGSPASWAPTDPMTLPTGGIPDGWSVMAALEFVAPQSAGSWQIDDVLVDPYRSG